MTKLANNDDSRNSTGVQEAEAGQGPGLLLILFVGDVVASTGESWCPGKLSKLNLY